MRLPGTNFDYGRPQFFATLLLLAFLVQAAFLSTRIGWGRSKGDAFDLLVGIGALQHQGLAGCEYIHTCIAALAARVSPQQPTPRAARVPFVLLGGLLGASIWYVTRRLYGNAGGYIALSLYCFSFPALYSAAQISPAPGAAWGVFGIVFTAVALAHTIYAPWGQSVRRITFLAAALLIGFISAPNTALVALALAFALLLYLGPGERIRALLLLLMAVFIAAAFVAVLTPSLFWQVGLIPPWGGVSLSVSAISVSAILRWQGTPFLILGSVATLGLVGSPRSRYFGNLGPFFCALVLLLWANASTQPSEAESVAFAPVTFLVVFIAGVWSDLLESKHGRIFTIVGLVLLAAHAIGGTLTVLRWGVAAGP